LAAAIKKSYGVEAKLIEGAGGIFDVKVDGKLIYSKHDTGQFPEDSEVIRLLAAHKK
jgi:selenoprotein W-related protein